MNNNSAIELSRYESNGPVDQMKLSKIDESATAHSDYAANSESGASKDVGAINFDEELANMKKRDELDIPYVHTQVEDAMYVDSHTVVTLEYHCYQNYV